MTHPPADPQPDRPDERPRPDETPPDPSAAPRDDVIDHDPTDPFGPMPEPLPVPRKRLIAVAALCLAHLSYLALPCFAGTEKLPWRLIYEDMERMDFLQWVAMLPDCGLVMAAVLCFRMAWMRSAWEIPERVDLLAFLSLCMILAPNALAVQDSLRSATPFVGWFVTIVVEIVLCIAVYAAARLPGEKAMLLPVIPTISFGVMEFFILYHYATTVRRISLTWGIPLARMWEMGIFQDLRYAIWSNLFLFCISTATCVLAASCWRLFQLQDRQDRAMREDLGLHEHVRR